MLRTNNTGARRCGWLAAVLGACLLVSPAAAAEPEADVTGVTVDTPLLTGPDGYFRITVTMSHVLAWRSTNVWLDGAPYYCCGAAEGHPVLGPFPSATLSTVTIDVPRPPAGTHTVGVVPYNGAACDGLPMGAGSSPQNLYVVDCTPPADHDVLVDPACLYMMEDFTTFCIWPAGLTAQQTPPAGDSFGPGAPINAQIDVIEGAATIGTFTFVLNPVDDVPPQITECPADREIEIGANGKADVPDLTGEVVASDNCPVPLLVTQNPAAGTQVTLGDSPVTVEMQATDTNPANPPATCSVQITVVDRMPPWVVLCKDQFLNSALSIGTPVLHPSLVGNGNLLCALDNSGRPVIIRIVAIDGDLVTAIPEGDPRRPVGHTTAIVPLGEHALVFAVCDLSVVGPNCTLFPTDVYMLPAVPMACWDLNANGLGEPEEDRNGDGNFDPLDCQGVSCWDINGNLTCDVLLEDITGDGICDALDCQGAPGISCWDLNQNSACDLPDEDPNGDGVCDPKDCHGLACWDLNGNGLGDPDEDVNGDGNFDSLDCQGVSCWDTDGNHVGEPAEDRNGDGNYDTLDCQGLACWDLNGNLTCDLPDEDSNGSGACDAIDCLGARGPTGPRGSQGQQGDTGATGLVCWDLDGSGLGEPAEDINGDGNYNALDCQGAAGAEGAAGPEGAQGVPGESPTADEVAARIFPFCGAVGVVELTLMLAGLWGLSALQRRREV